MTWKWKEQVVPAGDDHQSDWITWLPDAFKSPLEFLSLPETQDLRVLMRS